MIGAMRRAALAFALLRLSTGTRTTTPTRSRGRACARTPRATSSPNSVTRIRAPAASAADPPPSADARPRPQGRPVRVLPQELHLRPRRLLTDRFATTARSQGSRAASPPGFRYAATTPDSSQGTATSTVPSPSTSASRVPSAPGQQKGDSTSLQRECSARARSGISIYASRAFREMIARPKISRNEWKTAEI